MSRNANTDPASAAGYAAIQAVPESVRDLHRRAAVTGSTPTTLPINAHGARGCTCIAWTIRRSISSKTIESCMKNKLVHKYCISVRRSQRERSLRR